LGGGLFWGLEHVFIVLTAAANAFTYAYLIDVASVRRAVQKSARGKCDEFCEKVKRGNTVEVQRQHRKVSDALLELQNAIDTLKNVP
jgi:hypothetical protein